MRRFLSTGSVFSPFLRFVLAGTRDGVPVIGSVPSFETRRRRRMRLSSEQANIGVTGIADVVRVPIIEEEEAKSLCFEKYGFLQRPLVLNSWSEFLCELQRFEFRWSLAPGTGGIIILDIFQHGEGEKVLCTLRGCSGCTPIADFFECCGCITQGSLDKYTIRFRNPEGAEHLLEVVGKRWIPEKKVLSSTIDEPVLPVLAQYNCTGTSLNVSIKETRTGVVTSLFNGISLQTFNYAFLSSIPVFLKRTDIGVRNVDFISKEQMRHFRFAWCFLRRESMLTPVDIAELDALLPI